MDALLNPFKLCASCRNRGAYCDPCSQRTLPTAVYPRYYERKEINLAHPYDEAFRPKEALTPVHKPKPVAALDVQVGGDHYKTMKIQPVEFAIANKLDFFQKDVIKYVTRRKGDVEKRLEDLAKAKHYIDLYMDAIKKGEFI